MNKPDSEPTKGPDVRISIGGQLVIPVLAVILTLYYFTTIIESPWTAQVSALMIGLVLIGLCLVFMVKTALRVARGQADLRMSELYTAQDLTNGRVALFSITLAYILLINWGGFTITTFFFLFSSMLVLNNGRRKLLAASVAGLMSLGGYGLFILAFDTRFPRGPFENLMEAVLNNGV
jgi:Tripartite tricarboxylate transporter TctB family